MQNKTFSVIGVVSKCTVLKNKNNSLDSLCDINCLVQGEKKCYPSLLLNVDIFGDMKIQRIPVYVCGITQSPSNITWLNVFTKYKLCTIICDLVSFKIGNDEEIYRATYINILRIADSGLDIN